MLKIKQIFTNKIFRRVAAGAMTAVLATGVVVGCGYSFGWFGNNEIIDNDGMYVADVQDGEINGMTVGLTYTGSSKTASLTSSAVTSTTYTFTVTVGPTTASNQYVDISLAWASTNSATLSDYVTVDQTLVESGDTVTVTCKQAFGTAIKLTAASNYDSSVYATATLGYVKRVSSVTVSSPGAITFSSSSTDHTISLTPTYGTGTVTPTISITGGTLSNNVSATTSVSNSAYSEEEGTYITYIRTATTGSYTFTGSTLTVSTPYAAFVTGTSTYSSAIASSTRVSGNSFKLKSALNDISSGNSYMLSAAVVDATYPTVATLTATYNSSFAGNCTGTTSDGTLTVNYTYSYGGTQYGSSSVSVGVAFSASSLVVSTTSVTLDETEVYF